MIDRILREAFPGPLEAQLVGLLRDAGNLRLSLLAESDGDAVGYVAFSPVLVSGSDNGWGLAPVAVVPKAQRQGIGQALVRAGLAACVTAGCGFIVVLGDPDYYGRFFGFAPAAGWKLRDEYGGGEVFQALELQPGAIPSSGGVVKYAPEFAIFAPT